MRIAIVEDEILIADHLAMCLEEEGYEVVGSFTNATEAIEQFAELNVDLFLLDINLEGHLDGIDLAGHINTKLGVPFIYLTSNTDPRTLERVKLTSPAGFIVKPFQPKDLRPAIELAWYKFQQNKALKTAKTPKEDSFLIKDKEAMHRIFYNEIDYVEAADNYVLIFVNKKRFILSQTLKTIAQKLEQYGFLRIHRSYVINLQKVDCLKPGKVQLGTIELPVSSKARQELLSYFNTL